MTLLAKSFGAALRRFRTDAGVSQDDFALTCGLHRTYIGRVERGEVNVGLDNIARLARALGLPASGLVQAAEGYDTHDTTGHAGAATMASGGAAHASADAERADPGREQASA